MPTDKRARQRAQRQVKVAYQQQRRKRARRVRRAVMTVFAVALLVGVIALVSEKSTPKKPAATTTTTTTTIAKAAVAPVCPPATAAGAATRVTSFSKQPPDCIKAGVHYYASVVTDVGTFVISLFPSAQLRAVDNFVFLARYHFFNGIIFQRVIPGFVVQGGDPTGTGSGGPGYQWTGNTPPASCTAAKDCYAPYDVAYANSSTPTSNESQFFIILPGGQNDLSPDYTLFGQVILGRPVVDKIGADGAASGTPKVVHKMLSVTISTTA